VCELVSSARIGRYLRQTATGGLRIDRAAVKTAMRYDGKWVITTNDDTLTAEDLALGYKQLMRVEQCWRQLKSGLRMRPVFHYRPWRIQAHVTISVMALLVERIAEIRTGETWRNLADQLDRVKVVEYDHNGARVRQTSEIDRDRAPRQARRAGAAEAARRRHPAFGLVTRPRRPNRAYPSGTTGESVPRAALIVSKSGPTHLDISRDSR
jgi:hypothetical protein